MDYLLVVNEKQIQKGAPIVENMETSREVANLRHAESDNTLKILYLVVYLLVKAL